MLIGSSKYKRSKNPVSMSPKLHIDLGGQHLENLFRHQRVAYLLVHAVFVGEN